MEVKWKIDQGGGPFIVEVPDKDLDSCESNDDRERMIQEYIDVECHANLSGSRCE